MSEDYPAYSNLAEAKAEVRSYIHGLNGRAVELASATLKALLLLNGGAAVAMLGFVASVSGNDAFGRLELAEVVSALQIYALGAAFAGLATGIGYIVLYMQATFVISRKFIDERPYIHAGSKSRRIYRVYAAVHLSSVLVALLSFAAFLAGVWRTGNIFSVIG